MAYSVGQIRAPFLPGSGSVLSVSEEQRRALDSLAKRIGKVYTSTIGLVKDFFDSVLDSLSFYHEISDLKQPRGLEYFRLFSYLAALPGQARNVLKGAAGWLDPQASSYEVRDHAFGTSYGALSASSKLGGLVLLANAHCLPAHQLSLRTVRTIKVVRSLFSWAILSILVTRSYLNYKNCNEVAEVLQNLEAKNPSRRGQLVMLQEKIRSDPQFAAALSFQFKDLMDLVVNTPPGAAADSILNQIEIAVEKKKHEIMWVSIGSVVSLALLVLGLVFAGETFALIAAIISLLVVFKDLVDDIPDYLKALEKKGVSAWDRSLLASAIALLTVSSYGAVVTVEFAAAQVVFASAAVVGVALMLLMLYRVKDSVAVSPHSQGNVVGSHDGNDDLLDALDAES